MAVLIDRVRTEALLREAALQLADDGYECNRTSEPLFARGHEGDLDYCIGARVTAYSTRERGSDFDFIDVMYARLDVEVR